MTKLVVDFAAAKEYIKRYFAGKGNKIDEVEIIELPAFEYTATIHASSGGISCIGHGPKRCCNCGSDKVKDLFIYTNGDYSFRCVDCGRYQTTHCNVGGL